MDPANTQPPYQAPAPAPTPAPAPAYAQGCLAAAWADIKATPNYVSRLVVLGLIMCVPILNFVAAGYLLRWSREVPFGGRTPLPQKMVNGKNFEFGFYAFVLSLVVGLASGLVGAVIGWVPVLGYLVSLAVGLAAGVASYLMQMRMIMGLNLGDGFNVSDLWEKGRRAPGQLLLVTLVPSLVAGAIVTVIIFVATLFCLLFIFGSTAGMAVVSGGDPTFAQVMAMIGSVAGPIILCSLISFVASCLVMAPAEALTCRALGHWTARYAPEWAALANTHQPY